jgi:poly(3-hydroxybutyrate) depolymerase
MQGWQGIVSLGILVIIVMFSCCSGPPGSAIPATPSVLPSSGPASGTTTSSPQDSSGIPVGSGRYVFTDLRGNAGRPITVYTYRPATWNTSGPVLIVMHGAGRVAAPSRDVWIPYGDRYSCLIVAPEFSSQYYAGDTWYPGGNLFDEQMNWQPQQNWTYTAIEHIFDDVRNRTGARQETYLLFGFSAGGQFVHRLATFLPDARYSRAVASSAGLYAMPTYSVEYGFGLKGSPLREVDLPKVFSRKLIVVAGGDDNDPDAGGLANFPAAEAQGTTRLERAKNYIATAKKEAQARGIPLDWEFYIVPGVGHDEAGMAGPAAEQLFGPGPEGVPP